MKTRRFSAVAWLRGVGSAGHAHAFPVISQDRLGLRADPRTICDIRWSGAVDKPADETPVCPICVRRLQEARPVEQPAAATG